MGIVPDEFRNFRCVSNQSSSGRGIYLYVCIYIYIAEIHPLAFVSCGFSSIFPFRYRNDLSLTWTSIFVQSLRFSFTTTLHRPFPNGFHLTVSGRRGQLASRREQAHHRREKREATEARGNCKRPRGVKQKRIGIKGLLFLTRCVSKTRATFRRSNGRDHLLPRLDPPRSVSSESCAPSWTNRTNSVNRSFKPSF